MNDFKTFVLFSIAVRSALTRIGIPVGSVGTIGDVVRSVVPSGIVERPSLWIVQLRDSSGGVVATSHSVATSVVRLPNVEDLRSCHRTICPGLRSRLTALSYVDAYVVLSPR
jgi:hypothetical protein